uniref:Uncharacterized protein n=1 Tax=Rhizophora mucronata TaxID=61149 RepID=A0A2P2QMY3_RHIMU
MGAAVQIL